MFRFGSLQAAVGLAAIGLTAIGLIAASECKKSQPNPFPASGSVTGWEKTSETRTYAAKDLWKYIDGDAEQYIQAGVISTSTSDYRYEGRLEAVVDVNTMGTAEGARRILEDERSAEAQSVPLGDSGIAYAQSIVFRKGTNLVRIIAYDDKAGNQQALYTLAQGIEAKL